MHQLMPSDTVRESSRARSDVELLKRRIKTLAAIANFKMQNANFEQVIPLHLFDGISYYTLYVSSEIHARAEQDLSFASTLLHEHKAALNKQVSNTLGTNEEYLQNDKDNLTFSNKENYNHLNSKSNNSRIIWTSKQTQLLLHLYETHSTSLNNGEINNRLFWKHLQQGMDKEGYAFSNEQCKTKINNLKKMYKDVKDHNAQSGNNRKTCEHYDILDKLFSQKPWVKPLSVAGSDIPMGKELEEKSSNSKRQKLSSSDWKSEFVEEYKNNKRLQREATTDYRKQKLNILKEITEALKKSNI